MESVWLFLAATTLIIFAVVGLTLLSGMRQHDGKEQSRSDEVKTDTTDAEPTEDKPTYSSLGESIYYAGIGSEGRESLYCWAKLDEDYARKSMCELPRR